MIERPLISFVDLVVLNKVKDEETLVSVTNNVFSEVTVSSIKVVQLMEEIAAASQEQSQGIDQVSPEEVLPLKEGAFA